MSWYTLEGLSMIHRIVHGAPEGVDHQPYLNLSGWMCAPMCPSVAKMVISGLDHEWTEKDEACDAQPFVIDHVSITRADLIENPAPWEDIEPKIRERLRTSFLDGCRERGTLAVAEPMLDELLSDPLPELTFEERRC